MKKLLKVSVPTATLILHRESDPLQIVVLKSQKFPGWILPGGKKRVGIQSWSETAIAEAKEETGLTPQNLRIFTLCSRPGRDVRTRTIEKFADGGEFPTDLAAVAVETHHDSDIVFAATGMGTLAAIDGEALELRWLDLREPLPEFSLDHGGVVQAWVKFIETGEHPALDAF